MKLWKQITLAVVVTALVMIGIVQGVLTLDSRDCHVKGRDAGVEVLYTGYCYFKIDGIWLRERDLYLYAGDIHFGDNTR